MRVVLLSSLSLALLSCTGADEPGLVLAMSTDLIVPEDVHSVGLYMQHLEPDGKVRRRWTFAASPIFDGTNYVVRFPATLAVASRKVDGDRLRTRVVAFTNGPDGLTPLVMREARTTMPTDRAAVLRLPMLWINAGTVTDHAPGAGIGNDTTDPFSRFESDCPAEQTRGDSGECESIDIPLESLSAPAETPETACFRVDEVFGPGADLVRAEIPANAGCAIALGRSFDASRTQVALVTASGYEVGADRVRPLPRSAFEVRGASLQLTPRACADLSTARAVLVSERATDASVETVCANWTNAPAPVPVSPAVPSPVTPDATLVDSGIPDVGLPDASLPDASLPVDWTLPPDVSAVVLNAGGIYASTASALYKYSLTPGDAVATAPPIAGELHAVGVDGAGKDLLFVSQDATLSRLNPDTLAPTPVEICLAGVCRTLGSADLGSLAVAPVLRGGDDRLYFLVSEPVFESAPRYVLVSTALDGSGAMQVSNNLFDLMSSPPTLPGAIYPSANGIVMVAQKADFYAPYRCSSAGCSSGNFSTTPGYYRAVSLSAFSRLSGMTSYGRGSWETNVNGVYGSYTGIVRIEDTTVTSIVPDAATSSSLVRSADHVCWHFQGALSCVDANAPATLHQVDGVQVGADLMADDTYVYWTNGNRTLLQRRLWTTLF